MAKVSASEYADKWARRLKGATSDIASGIEKVTESPGKKAAAKRQKWIARMTDPTTQDKWAKNIGNVPLDEWKRKAIEVGIGRISAGVDASTNKVEQFAQQLLSYQESVLPKIKSMPDVTLADSKARLDAWFDAMSKFRPSK